MAYTDAPATRMLATHCCCCGLPLVDAISVELGIGPICRQEETGGIAPDVQERCNALTYEAAIAAQAGLVDRVNAIADQIAALGLTNLADKITSRFDDVARKVKIRITPAGHDTLAVDTPYRRGDAEAFLAAWRAIPGRRFRDGKNHVPVASKPQLWALLRKFFPGVYGEGPNGIFRVPKHEEN